MLNSVYIYYRSTSAHEMTLPSKYVAEHHQSNFISLVLVWAGGSHLRACVRACVRAKGGVVGGGGGGIVVSRSSIARVSLVSRLVFLFRGLVAYLGAGG